MNIHVFTDHINITTNDIINKNEYNAHPCIFNFEIEYDGLIKKALFENEEGLLYEMIITNNRCEIPSEVLTHVGTVKIGVYGYKVNNDTLELRYSPKPVTFIIDEGSFKEGAENSSDPTPTELEQVEQAVSDIEDDITDIKGDIEDIQEDISGIKEDMEDFCTATDVQSMIDTAYTNVMEGEY